MRIIAMVLILLSGVAGAQTAPQPKFDLPYWTATAAAGIGTGLDAYTSVAFIHPGTHCYAEGGFPMLYGRQPSPARVTLVMGGEFAASAFLAHAIRKRLRPEGNGFRQRLERSLWLLPFAESSGHWQGAIHNFEHCR